MNYDARPIGVFDSGVGGISVLTELVKLMPNENFIYFGDSANAPYGTRPLDDVKELALNAAEYLTDRGCKALVVACNTATVAAITTLRSRYSHMPVIGIEPALKPAVLANPGGDILVMATHVTLNQTKFLNLLARFEKMAHIHTLECPGLVEFIERSKTDTDEFGVYLRVLLEEYRHTPPDAVVLGCTHYPFAKKRILEVFGNAPVIYDGGNGTARETLRRLKMYGMEAPCDNCGTVVFLNSRPSEADFCRNLFESSMKGI